MDTLKNFPSPSDILAVRKGSLANEIDTFSKFIKSKLQSDYDGSPLIIVLDKEYDKLVIDAVVNRMKSNGWCVENKGKQWRVSTQSSYD